MDDPMGVVLSIDALAWATAAQKKAAQAVTLLRAAEGVWADIPATPPRPLREHHDAALAAAREALPKATYQAALAQGKALDQTEAIAFALGESSRPTPAPDRTQAGASPGQLTRREQDVAVLVARGLSNGQIAAALVISARTVEKHVQHIMDKLGVSTRAQIAAWSAARPSASPAPGSGASGS
jgi:non-specific serine/threonine protein kinase